MNWNYVWKMIMKILKKNIKFNKNNKKYKNLVSKKIEIKNFLYEILIIIFICEIILKFI